MPVGLFVTDTKFEFTTHIFIEQKPDYYDFANHTKMMTGEQVIAALLKKSKQHVLTQIQVKYYLS